MSCISRIRKHTRPAHFVSRNVWIFYRVAQMMGLVWSSVCPVGYPVARSLVGTTPASCSQRSSWGIKHTRPGCKLAYGFWQTERFLFHIAHVCGNHAWTDALVCWTSNRWLRGTSQSSRCMDISHWSCAPFSHGMCNEISLCRRGAREDASSLSAFTKGKRGFLERACGAMVAEETAPCASRPWDVFLQDGDLVLSGGDISHSCELLPDIRYHLQHLPILWQGPVQVSCCVRGFARWLSPDRRPVAFCSCSLSYIHFCGRAENPSGSLPVISLPVLFL